MLDLNFGLYEMEKMSLEVALQANLEGFRLIRENQDMFLKSLETENKDMDDFYAFLEGSINKKEYAAVAEAVESFLISLGYDEYAAYDLVDDMKDYVRAARR